jgi:hypothetical protein
MSATDEELPRYPFGHLPEGEPLSDEDAASARTAERIRDLRNLRLMAFQIAAEVMENCAPGSKEKVQGFERMERSVRCLTVLEEELEKSRQDRRKMLRNNRLARTKEKVQKAVKDAVVKAKPTTPQTDLQKVMRDAFADYKTIDDYDGTPEEIVHRVCEILGVTPDPDLWPAPGTVPKAPPAPPVILRDPNPPILRLRENPPLYKPRPKPVAFPQGPNGHDPP